MRRLESPAQLVKSALLSVCPKVSTRHTCIRRSNHVSRPANKTSWEPQLITRRFCAVEPVADKLSSNPNFCLNKNKKIKIIYINEQEAT